MNATVDSCNCLTKCPDIKYHKPDCHYRIIVELHSELSTLKDRAERAEKHRDDLLKVLERPFMRVSDLNRAAIEASLLSSPITQAKCGWTKVELPNAVFPSYQLGCDANKYFVGKDRFCPSCGKEIEVKQ